MSYLKSFIVDLRAVPHGETSMQLHVNKCFFEELQGSDIKDGNLESHVSINRINDLFDLNIHTTGHVIVPCDICLDDMPQEIDAHDHYIVTFEETDSDDDNHISVAHSEGCLDLSWLIYQSVYLNIPLRHVHTPGNCNPVMMRKIAELSVATRSDAVDKEETTDNRWSALKNLNLKE